MNTTYDIAIIGGGIHGSACAHAAAEAGYSVVVLEQYDKPGLATSSKSSKLIHGGLRYLETGQFKLVHECLQQRKYLLENNPDLVKLVPFYIPVYKNTSRSPWIIRLGLMIYSLFSKKPFKTIPKDHWPALDGLKTENLRAVFQYYDAQTDDQLLTQETMYAALELGARLITDATFKSASCENNICKVEYDHSGETKHIAANILLNATGPWVNHVLEAIKPQQTQLDIDLVLGTHIIVPGNLTQGMYYLEAPQDKRAVFIMPWKNNIMIGTTEVIFKDSPEKVAPPDADIEYLLEVYNHYFKKPLNKNDVIDAFAGLRVLPADTGSAFKRTRDTIIHHNNIKQPKVFTLYGGKLTAHRATAKQVINTIRPFI